MSPDELVYLARNLPDGRRAEVVPLTYGRARIVVGRVLPGDPGLWFYDDVW